MLHFLDLLYLPEIIRTKIISRHHDDSLAEHFGIEKTRELFTWKYSWPTLRADIDAYVKGCNICLTLKIVRDKPYRDLQSLPVPTYGWKDLSMDFVKKLPVSTNWKSETYDSILLIVDWLSKMVHYKPVKVTIDTPELAKVIINGVVRHHDLPDFIVSDWCSVFNSKFWSLLCYFLGIKQRLFTVFNPQIDPQTERQNSTMKPYLRAFINYKQND